MSYNTRTKGSGKLILSIIFALIMGIAGVIGGVKYKEDILAKLDPNEKLMSNYKTQLEEKQAEYNLLTVQLEQTKATLRLREASLQEKTDTLLHSEMLLATKTNEVVTITNEKATLQTQLNAKTTALNTALAEKQSLQTDKETLLEKVAELELQANADAESIADLNAKITAKNAEIETKTATILTLTNDKATLQIQLNDKTTALETAQAEVTRLTNEKATLQTELATAQADVTRLTNEVATLQAQLDNVQQNITDYTNSIVIAGKTYFNGDTVNLSYIYENNNWDPSADTRFKNMYVCNSDVPNFAYNAGVNSSNITSNIEFFKQFLFNAFRNSNQISLSGDSAYLGVHAFKANQIYAAFVPNNLYQMYTTYTLEDFNSLANDNELKQLFDKLYTKLEEITYETLTTIGANFTISQDFTFDLTVVEYIVNGETKPERVETKVPFTLSYNLNFVIPQFNQSYMQYVCPNYNNVEA